MVLVDLDAAESLNSMGFAADCLPDDFLWGRAALERFK